MYWDIFLGLVGLIVGVPLAGFLAWWLLKLLLLLRTKLGHAEDPTPETRRRRRQLFRTIAIAILGIAVVITAFLYIPWGAIPHDESRSWSSSGWQWLEYAYVAYVPAGVRSFILTYIWTWWFAIVVGILFLLDLLRRGKKAQVIALVVLVAVGSIAYWFGPELTCADDDIVCKAQHLQQKQIKAAEELHKEQERQRQAALAIEQARIATQKQVAEAAGGAQCLNVAHKDHQFGTAPDESSIINPDGKCFFANFYPPEDEGICFYQQSAHSSKPHGPFGRDCPGAIPFNQNTAPRDVERIWGNKPFKANFVLRPRSGTNHGTSN
ncbi:hypothetical protein A2419_00375 [Candidatus Adlerbacteria bacterium RIFOXYC1_FULL_48_26]|uniref:Uncharacterized protein n=1 Tax=Candidatus Adlerbacteria bacterium RIFOXYC1_FULL_48_26 TaxID=1797247 RepID=A0A1F4Y359_9BACT|nr:MAG: hypothetical protein A2419_00375 [Candidatus Adlerbacteria bacterium RIFOXYC1_FULL_48_26]